MISIGYVIAKNLKSRVKITQESMSIFRQVKLDDLTDQFYNNFMLAIKISIGIIVAILVIMAATLV